MFGRNYEYDAINIEYNAFTLEEDDKFELRAEDNADVVFVRLTRKELKALKKEIGRLLDETKGSN